MRGSGFRVPDRIHSLMWILPDTAPTSDPFNLKLGFRNSQLGVRDLG